MELYSEYYVSKSSERFVNKVWVLDNSKGECVVNDKLVLPNGCFNLAVVNGNYIEVFTSKIGYMMYSGLYFCSQMTNKVIVNIQPRTKVTIIQFHPWTLSMFPKYNLNDFTDSIVKLSQLHIPFEINVDVEIQQLMIELNHFFEKLNAINPDKNSVEKLCEIISQYNEDIHVSEIASLLNCSQRLIQIRFKKATGLTVKKYIQIIKFRKSVDDMVEKLSKDVNLSHIAHSKNYFDQSHFIKDFKTITKITPGMFEPDSYFLSKKR